MENNNLKERHIVFNYKAGNFTRTICGILKNINNDYFTIGRKGYFFSNIEGDIFNYHTKQVIDIQKLNI